MCKFILSLAAVALSLSLAQTGFAAGVGVAKKLDVAVTFNDPMGFTVTNDQGTFYNFYGFEMFEPKVYLPQHWGTFPLYFVDQNMNFSVAVSNTAAKGKKFKLRIVASHHALLTDGSSGMALAPDQEFIVDNLVAGESRVINASIYIAPDPNLESGLDITTLRIYHLNNGSSDAGLIKEFQAVWCPPDHEDALAVLSSDG